MLSKYSYKNVVLKVASVAGAISNLEAKFLYNCARFGPGKGVIVEIGSFCGKSTIFLASGSKARNNQDKVYAIDPHQGARAIERRFSGPTYKVFLGNLKAAKVRDWVQPIKKFSFEVSKNWKRPIRLLFIDGNHSYTAVRRDILEWEPWVQPDGIIAFHDALNPAAGVSRAIIKYLLDNNKLSQLGVVDSIFYGIKARKKRVKDRIMEVGIRLAAWLLRSKLPVVRQYLVKRWLKQLLTQLSRL